MNSFLHLAQGLLDHQRGFNTKAGKGEGSLMGHLISMLAPYHLEPWAPAGSPCSHLLCPYMDHIKSQRYFRLRTFKHKPLDSPPHWKGPLEQGAQQRSLTSPAIRPSPVLHHPFSSTSQYIPNGQCSFSWTDLRLTWKSEDPAPAPAPAPAPGGLCPRLTQEKLPL